MRERSRGTFVLSGKARLADLTEMFGSRLHPVGPLRPLSRQWATVFQVASRRGALPSCIRRRLPAGITSRSFAKTARSRDHSWVSPGWSRTSFSEPWTTKRKTVPSSRTRFSCSNLFPVAGASGAGSIFSGCDATVGMTLRSPGTLGAPPSCDHNGWASMTLAGLPGELAPTITWHQNAKPHRGSEQRGSELRHSQALE